MRIGLHSVYRCKSRASLDSGNLFSLQNLIYSICNLLSVAGVCCKYILSIMCLLNFILGYFCDHTTASTPTHTVTIKQFQNALPWQECRIVFSCLLLCVIRIIPVLIVTLQQYGISSVLNSAYLRLFHKKSLGAQIINFYSIWLFAMNILLLITTIPNISNPGPSSHLNILFQNVQGFVNLQTKSTQPCLYESKVLEFQGYVFNKKPDVVILNEPWLKDTIMDSEIFPNNSYKIFRRDRSLKSHPHVISDPKKFKRNGGGVVIAFRSDLDITTEIFKLKDGPAKAEIISVVVTPVSGPKICISTLYRVGTLGAENLSEIRRHLQAIASSKSCCKHIIVGDFNLSKTLWPDGISSCSLETEFISMFDDLGLEQVIDFPTHTHGNTLDLLLCNTSELVSDIKVLPKDTVCRSDHFGLEFKIQLKCKRLKSTKRKIYNLKKANFSAINRELCRINWDNVFNNCSSDLALDKFDAIFTSICDRHIPKVTTKSSFQPPWFDSELDNICKSKNKLLDKFKQTGEHRYKDQASILRKQFKKLCTQKKLDNVMNSDDPALVKKKFWSYYKSTSNSCRVPNTVHYKSKFRCKNTDKANLFNQYFSDQFSPASSYNIDINFENDPYTNVSFSENTVFNFLRKLNANKAAGPDGRQAKLIKCCAWGLSKPLSKLYTMFFRSGSIPKLWKLANIVPVHKKGDKSSVENYRPISLTCLPMKVFEYCVKDLLINKCRHLIHDSQHGFLPKRSCTTQMIPFSDNLSYCLNRSSRIDVVYFDFAKAFDSVNHDIILQKLKKQFSIDGLLLKFVREYLQGRTQRVIIDGCESSTLPVLSGVPQGSILGPLLFVIFINDMQSVIGPGTNIALYADDTKIWREILLDEDQFILQQDIDKLYKWSFDNKMKFHPDKCKVLAVTNKSRIFALPFYEHFYSLNGVILDYVDSEKDLGVHINGKLNWNFHCLSLARKANQRLGFVRRTCSFVLSPAQRKVLYLSLVRSMFEHCSPIWALQSVAAINAFDHLQKRAVKWILGEPCVSYSDEEFLQKQWGLGLLPMKSKFVYTDTILFHKIVYNLIDINLPIYVRRQEPQDITRTTRSTQAIADGSDKLHFKCTVLPKIKCFENNFFNRTLKVWNVLPLSIREIEPSESFSVKLKEHLWLLLGLKPD